MGIPASIRKRLPKSNMITVRLWSTSMWTTFRLANARQIHFGHVVVIIRAPWLEASAKANFPNLFEVQE